MGFDETRAKKALVYFHNNLERAMDHIINAPDFDYPDPNASSSGSSQLSQSRSFTVNQDHLKTLIEMGYSDGQARHALKLFNNRLEAAVSYIMNNP
jgi:uncharacterized UBP type Zn finger protein